MRNLCTNEPSLARIKMVPVIVVMLMAMALSACSGSSGSSGGVSADSQQETGSGDSQDNPNGGNGTDTDTGTDTGTDTDTDGETGGDGDSANEVADGNSGDNVPGSPGDGQGDADPSSQTPALGLVIDSLDRCTPIFEPIQLVLSQQLAQGENAGGERPNVSNLVTIEPENGGSLNLVSRTDEGINFEISRQDIVSVTASLEDSMVTLFLAGYDRANPDSFILRKPANGGCMYAFKSEDFCATGFSTTGIFSTNRNGASISALGCELTNPNGLPVIELPAE